MPNEYEFLCNFLTDRYVFRALLDGGGSLSYSQERANVAGVSSFHCSQRGRHAAGVSIISMGQAGVWSFHYYHCLLLVEVFILPIQRGLKRSLLTWISLWRWSLHWSHLSQEETSLTFPLNPRRGIVAGVSTIPKKSKRGCCFYFVHACLAWRVAVTKLCNMDN